MKTEEEKVHLEQKTRDAVRLTEMLVQESEKRALEEKKLKDELLRARIAEKEAKEKLLEFLSRNAYTSAIAVINIIKKSLTNVLLKLLLTKYIFSLYQICFHQRKCFHQIYKLIYKHFNWIQNHCLLKLIVTI